MTFEQRRAAFPCKFGFDAEGHRRLPLQMEGVEGLHTVGLWTDKKNQILFENDEFDADCIVIWEEGFRSVVAPGVKFKLWESGFIADGLITERIEAGWNQK
jgi:hypothetical protein